MNLSKGKEGAEAMQTSDRPSIAKIAGHSEVSVAHHIQLKEQPETEKGLQASRSIEVTIKPTSGTQIKITSQPVDVLIDGVTKNGNLKYSLVNANDEHSNKDDHQAVLETKGDTEAYGLPSNVKGGFDDIIEQHEDAFGISAADELANNISDLVSQVKYEAPQPDRMIVTSHNGDILVEQSSLTTEAMSTQVNRNFNVLYEATKAIPDSDFNNQIFYSLIENNGDIKSSLIDQNDFEHLPESTKTRVISKEDFNDLRLKKRESGRPLESVVPNVNPYNIDYTDYAADSEAPKIRTLDDLIAQNGVIGVGRAELKTQDYASISKPIIADIAVLQVQDDVATGLKIISSFNARSPYVKNISLNNLKQDGLKNEINSFLDQYNGKKPVLISIDEKALEGRPSIRSEVEDIVVSRGRDKKDNVGIAVNNKHTKEYFEEVSPSMAVSRMDIAFKKTSEFLEHSRIEIENRLQSKKESTAVARPKF